MSDIEQRLREAMDGVTPGPWVCIENDEDRFDYDKLRISTEDRVYNSKGPIAEIDIGFNDPFETEQRRSAEFIALCSPYNIGALLDTIASLRSRLEEAEGTLERMAKKIAACNWYWPEDDTSSEACFESAQEVLDSAYIKRGEVLAVARGGVVEVTYCASLPPADDADSDDEFWVEEKTYEAAALKVAEEQSRRTLSSLREADHA